MLYFSHIRKSVKMKTLIGIIAYIILASTAICAFAGADNTDSATPQQPGSIASQGAKNALLGWTEIPKSVVSVTNESKNPLTGVTRGALQGIARAFSKTVSGIARMISPSSDDAGRPAMPKTQTK